MFYYQEFSSRWEKIKSQLDEVDKIHNNLNFSIVIENLDELLTEILNYAERKPKKKEKFYLRLLNELCENLPGLMWGEDEDHDFKETLYMWNYNDEISRSGYTSYEELAKDIMLHLKIEK